MKINIVTQVYNAEHRIKDWLHYHKKIGVDSIIVFDDLSIDSTAAIVDEYNKKDSSVIRKNSDKPYKQNIIFRSGNDYGGNTDIYWRFVRSYNQGLIYFKQFEDSIVFFIDIDEFLVPTTSCNIQDVLYQKTQYERFFVPSYDMKPPPEGFFKKNIPVWEQSTHTWSQKTRRELQGGWDMRLKTGARTQTLESTLINFWHVHSSDVGQLVNGIPSNFQNILNYDYTRTHQLTPWDDTKHCFLGDSLRGSAFGLDIPQIIGDYSLVMLHFRDYPDHNQNNYDYKFDKINKILNL